MTEYYIRFNLKLYGNLNEYSTRVEELCWRYSRLFLRKWTVSRPMFYVPWHIICICFTIVKLHTVGKALRLNTRPRDRVQNGKIPRYKDELIVTAKISTGFAEAPLSRNAMQADDGEEAPPPSSPTAPSGSERCAACPVGLASHGSSSEHVGGNKWAFSLVESCSCWRSHSRHHQVL